jgi:GNAT superfamily N-acetyltransferase
VDSEDVPVEFRAVSGERWPDLERLFSESASEELGNPSRCWCMEWRLASHREWRESAEAGGEGNREGMRRFVASGQVPGIIAYVDGVPAAWCSVSPKPPLVGLARVSERLDGTYGEFEDGDEWAVICFYVPEKHRGIGLMGQLLEAAVAYAAEQGARVVEGYPMDAGWETDGAGGTRKAFELAGFVEVRRAGEHQSVMVWDRQRAGGARLPDGRE